MKVAGVALALAAVVLLVYGLLVLLTRDRSRLGELDRYTDPSAARMAADGDDEVGSGLVQTALVRSAVAATTRFAERQGLLTRVESALERANLPLRADEALFFYVAAATIALPAAVATSQSILGVLITAAAVVLGPPSVVSFLAARRQRQFTALLPDTLQLLAGSLRAGYSLMQGVDVVSREVDEPMARELRRVVTESRLGRPLEEALADAASRMESLDFDWAIMAITIQREVGGNLAELLDTVADTMIQRERLRRDVAALTAEGRISAIVLGILPVGLGLMLWTLNPDYIGALFEEPKGQAMLAGAGVLALTGFYWLKKTIEVEV